MAYYSQYQAQPGWGSQQYALTAPPAPTYQPQPSWRGADYYSAHYGQPDNSLFDYVWARVRGAFVGIGVGKEEAKYWHRRVYGGLVDIPGMEPRNVGAAAGYEALRIWQYHKAVYRQPLSDDHEREREALAGLAVGEASKLWQYTGRFSDKYGRREACEVAAATAQRVFNERYDYDSYNAYEGAYSTRSRRNSFVGGMEEEPYDDAYGGGGYRRQRRLSTSSGYERDYDYPARPSSAMGYGGSAVGYSGSAVGYSPGAVGYSPGAVGYAGSAVGYPGSAVGITPGLATPYMGAGQSMQAVAPYATAVSPYGAPQTAYGAYPGGAGMYGQQQMMLAGGQYPQQSLYGAQQPGYAPGLGSSYGGAVDAYGRPRSNSLYYPGY